MKPHVSSAIERNLSTGETRRLWCVTFDDAGCVDVEYFGRFMSALRFAYHVAMGGSRWEFVA